MKNFLLDVWVVSRRESQKLRTWKRTLMGFGWMGFMFAVMGLIGGGFNSMMDFSKYGNSYSQFFISGFVAYFVAITGLQTGANLILDRDGLQKLFMVVPISRMAILLGIELNLMYYMIYYLIFFSVLIVIFKTFNIVNLALLFLFCLFVSTLFLSIGIWLSTMFDSVKTSEMVMGWINIVLLMLSGVMFPIQVLPDLAQKIFYLNPLTYIVDIIRYLMTGFHEFDFSLSITILGIFGFLSIFLGTYMYDKNLRK